MNDSSPKILVEREFEANLQNILTNIETGKLDFKTIGEGERALSMDYRGRFLFELLQNANDAGTIEGKDVFLLSLKADKANEASLYVANTGKAFDENDFTTICDQFQSAKDPIKYAGHKGVGFKSVLELTRLPEIHSGGFHFRFDVARMRDAVLEKLAGRRDLNIDLNKELQKLPQLRYPAWIDEVSTGVRSILGDRYDEESKPYSTVFYLPLLEARSLTRDVEKELREKVDPLNLLFLEKLDAIIVKINESLVSKFAKSHHNSDRTSYPQMIEISGTGISVPERDWIVFKMPINLRNEDKLHQAVLNLKDEKWKEIIKVYVSAAVNISSPSKAYPYYVYLPTSVETGYPLVLNADFYLSEGRKNIDFNDIEYNKLLLEKLADLTAEQVAPYLAEKLKDRALPYLMPRHNFEPNLKSLLDDRLAKVSWVFTRGSGMKKPGEVLTWPAVVAADHQLLDHLDALLGETGGQDLVPASFEKVPGARKFLQELGAKELGTEKLVSWIEEVAVRNKHDPGWFNRCYDFLRLYEEGLGHLGSAFREKLRSAAIILAHDGSLVKPSEVDVFLPPLSLASDSLPIETVPTPLRKTLLFIHRGIDLEREVKGRRVGSEIRDFLAPERNELALVRRFALQDIIENLEKFFSGDIWVHLTNEGKFEILRFLNNLFAIARSTEGIVPRGIPVPCRRMPASGKGSEPIEWISATQVYFHKKDLVLLYGRFDDVYFLVSNNDTEGISDRFISWLGVADIPRVLCYEVHRLSPDERDFAPLRYERSNCEFNVRKMSDIFGVGQQWQEYLTFIKGLDYAHSGTFVYQLRSLNYLDHFHRLNSDEQILLFEILTRNPERYLNHLRVEAFKVGGDSWSREVDSLLGFCLKNTEWLITAGRKSRSAPCETWYLAPGAIPKAKASASKFDHIAYLPHPDTKAYNLYLALGIRSYDDADIEDYLELLDDLSKIDEDSISSTRKITTLKALVAEIISYTADKLSVLPGISRSSMLQSAKHSHYLVEDPQQKLKWITPDDLSSPVWIADDSDKYKELSGKLTFMISENNPNAFDMLEHVFGRDKSRRISSIERRARYEEGGEKEFEPFNGPDRICLLALYAFGRAKNVDIEREEGFGKFAKYFDRLRFYIVSNLRLRYEGLIDFEQDCPTIFITDRRQGFRYEERRFDIYVDQQRYREKGLSILAKPITEYFELQDTSIFKSYFLERPQGGYSSFTEAKKYLVANDIASEQISYLQFIILKNA